MRIVLDAMGSDDCPEPEIQAAIQAARAFGEEIILVGPETELSTRLAEVGGTALPVRIVDAPETITMEDKGLKLALKAKKKSSRTSMAVGIDLVNDGEADAFVTAGNTGGALATAYFRLGLLPGVDRPALTALFPVENGYCVVLDIGANPESQARIYSNMPLWALSMRNCSPKKNPRIDFQMEKKPEKEMIS